MVQIAGKPDAWVFKIWDTLRPNRLTLRLIGAKDSFVTEHDAAVALCELEVAIGTYHDRNIRSMPSWFTFDRDSTKMLPWSIEGLRDINFGWACFTDDDCIATVRQCESSHIVASATCVVGPAHTLIYVRPHQGIRNGVNSYR